MAYYSIMYFLILIYLLIFSKSILIDCLNFLRVNICIDFYPSIVCDSKPTLKSRERLKYHYKESLFIFREKKMPCF